MFFKDLSIQILLSIFTILIINFINIGSAYAEVNCFSPDTKIMTPEGNISIEKLHADDSIIGYDFDSKSEVIYKVKNISQKSNLGYFLLNNRIESSGSNFVYLQHSNKLEITKVQLIEKYRNIIGKNNQNITIDSIQHFVAPFKCLKIVL